jgi:NAD(P)-dependent dehydrogenase (short-subunit alcohol dehydrogenase family)
MTRPAAVVTASDSGIGKATAVVLAEAGYDVGITWRSDEEGARGTAKEVEAAGGRPVVAQLDLSDAGTGAGVIDELAEALGRLDVLVNNAGVGEGGPFLETSLSDWRQVLEVNLTGAFVCAQAAARRMVKAGGGRIINVTSVHEHVPLPDGAGYVAAKHALGGLTKQMAFELGEHGILVNSVAPGEIATRMTGQEDEDPRGNERPVPVGRPGDAREVGALIAFLASADNGYVTGQSYVIDGGMLITTAQTR